MEYVVLIQLMINEDFMDLVKSFVSAPIVIQLMFNEDFMDLVESFVSALIVFSCEKLGSVVSKQHHAYGNPQQLAGVT